MSTDNEDSKVLYHLSQAVDDMRSELRDMKLKLESVRDSFIRFEAQKIETKIDDLDSRIGALETARDKVSGGLGLVGLIKDYGPTITMLLGFGAFYLAKGG